LFFDEWSVILVADVSVCRACAKAFDFPKAFATAPGSLGVLVCQWFPDLVDVALDAL